jgi:hypothetical protein
VYFGVSSTGVTAEFFGPRLKPNYLDPDWKADDPGYKVEDIKQAVAEFEQLETDLHLFGDLFPEPPPSLLSGLV